MLPCKIVLCGHIFFRLYFYNLLLLYVFSLQTPEERLAAVEYISAVISDPRVGARCAPDALALNAGDPSRYAIRSDFGPEVALYL